MKKTKNIRQQFIYDIVSSILRRAVKYDLIDKEVADRLIDDLNSAIKWEEER